MTRSIGRSVGPPEWARGSVGMAVGRDGAGGGRQLDVVGAAGDDVLAGGDALLHLDPAGRAMAEDERAALERLALDLDVGDRPAAVLEDGLLGDGERLDRRSGGEPH